MPSRVRNWDVALVHWAQQQVDLPFEYGTRDCGTLVRGACVAMYGEDLWPEIPYWVNATGALRVIAEFGTVAQMLRARGATRWPTPHFAQSGDVIVMAGDHSPFDESVMVVVGPAVISAHPEYGIEQLNLQSILDGPEPVEVVHLPHDVG
jgi:hypothetical protein